MIKKLRKAFTIIELVIVIAVIAVLAAVLIPTFSSLVDKANESVDMQLVKQMNTILEAEEITDDKPSTVFDAQDILKENGIIQFVPVNNNCVFYWVGTKNRILLWEKSTNDNTKGKVTYPDKLKKEYKDYSEVSNDWKDLSIEKTDENYILVEPKDNETMNWTFLYAIKNAKDGSIIKIPSNTDLDMNGIGFAIGQFLGANKSVTIDLNNNEINCEKAYSDGSHYSITICENSSLELINGKIVIPMNADNEAAIVCNSNSHLILRNIEIINEVGAAIYPSGDTSEVIIDNCIINGGSYGVVTNARQSNNIRVNITNSEIVSSKGVAIHINVKSNVLIDNCNIKGKGWGIIVRAGNVVISNSSITTTDGDVGTGKEDSDGYRDFANTEKEKPYWGQGFQQPYAILSIGDYSGGDSYSSETYVRLQNVKLISPNKEDIPDILLASGTKDVKKNIILIYDEDCTIDVSRIILFGDSYNRTSVDHTFEHKGQITVNGQTVCLENNKTKIG